MHVFDGRVQIENHRGSADEIELTAGDARIAEADGGWRKTTPKPENFLGFDASPLSALVLRR